MSDDLRFKHTFNCIITGPSGSGKSSFCIKLLQNSNRCLPRPSSVVAFCGATVRRTQSPLSTSEEEYSFTKVCQKILQTREVNRV